VYNTHSWLIWCASHSTASWRGHAHPTVGYVTGELKAEGNAIVDLMYMHYDSVCMYGTFLRRSGRSAVPVRCRWSMTHSRIHCWRTEDHRLPAPTCSSHIAGRPTVQSSFLHSLNVSLFVGCPLILPNLTSPNVISPNLISPNLTSPNLISSNEAIAYSCGNDTIRWNTIRRDEIRRSAIRRDERYNHLWMNCIQSQCYLSSTCQRGRHSRMEPWCEILNVSLPWGEVGP
jgi:hypothetical protein